MDVKLTIKLKDKTIKKAKEFARTQNSSLSKIIESYLDKITEEQNDDEEITPFIKSLAGIIKVPEGENDRSEYHAYLSKKYE